METVNSMDKIVLLFDNYTDEGEKLHTSLKKAGFDFELILLDDDGFGPKDAKGLYDYFTGDFAECKSALGKPMYFNQVKVPEYWEIAGNNSSANIFDMGKKKGSIYYVKNSQKRFVRIVEWTDDNGKVRCSDHYNKYGALFARTVFNKNGEKVNKTLFAIDGSEAVVENYVTKDITINHNGKVLNFKNKTEVAAHVLEERGLANCRVFYNSLSYPLFVSQRLNGERKEDILFWQENTRDDIPGNMRVILDERSNRTAKIVVQKKSSYDKLISLGANRKMLSCLGFIYPFERENAGGNQVLICTNSDQIAMLDNVLTALPDMHFHIAAITEMSTKLIAYEKYGNVTLYPNVKDAVLDGLFEKCDYYLDINRHSEIVNAVYRAFLNNQIIFGFNETKHNENYVADINVYSENDWLLMTEAVKTAVKNEAYRKTLLNEQHSKAMSEEVENYVSALR